MKRVAVGLAAALLCSAAAVGTASARDLVVTNARIVVGDGQVIEKGSVVVHDDKIVSVAPGAPASVPAGAQTIDASGMTVMPGFIDVHRHLIRGDAAKWFAGPGAQQMMALLEAGYTTVQSGGDETGAIVELKKKVASGEIKGPRIIAAGWTRINTLKTEAEVRAAIDATIKAGADSIAEIIYPQAANPFAPTELERRNLPIAIDEAKKFNVPVQVHAVSPAAMVEAVRLGATKLIHTPHYGWLTDEQAQEVAKAGAQVASCTSFGSPVFGVFNKDNKPTFRDGRPWPQGVLGGEGRGREAGYKPVNARTLFDNGVTFGYCTDTTYDPRAGLAQELKVLNLTFSPIDLVKVMGPNSAALLDRTDIGELKAGKLADMVVLAGDPLEGYWNFLNAVVVVKGGEVMVDKRGQLQTAKVLPN